MSGEPWSGSVDDGDYQVVAGPAGTRFSDVRFLAETDSTNRYVADAARHGAPEGLVVAAGHQRAGRGRLGRRWEAPPGRNLLVSVLLRPSMPADQRHLCTAVVALAAAEACRQTAGVEPAIKWPNDLVVGDRKLAGILAEVAGDEPAPAVVVGIGVNCGWPAPDGEAGEPPLPEALRDKATSLWREAGRRPEPLDVLEALLADLEPRVADLADPPGRLRQASAFRRSCSTLGVEVRVDLDGDSVTGRALDVTPEGHLVVDVGTCMRTIVAGDVVHLRPDA
ncbi:MAG TPA: biotin--[acetyl-CoA-carboxylase] ligase [Acidimicrobiales bacterium]|nr:biotin--[acetyl-CoA-carboxylase] ligase [Acidimicrobiales bacterium]